VTRTEAVAVLAALIAAALGSGVLGVWVGVTYRSWRPGRAGRLAADQDQAIAIVTTPSAPKPRVRVVWHYHPCGCICDSTGRRSLACAGHASQLRAVLDLAAWEKEMHP
jgi:hypothetical protein